MNWRNIILIFQREVLDQLRDRRTLFMVAVLPVLLYPLIGVGTTQLTTLFAEQPRIVVVLGANDLPPHSLLEGDRFLSQWFHSSVDQEKLHVVSDLADSPTESVSEESQERDAMRLQEARQLRELISEQQQLQQALSGELRSTENRDPKSVEIQLRDVERRLNSLFARSGIQVLVLIPSDFGERLARRQSRLQQRTAAQTGTADDDHPSYVIQNSADEKSAIAFRRVLDVMQAWERSILKQQLQESQLPPSLTTPVNLKEIDLADRSHVSASVWSKIFPALLVMMALTGAFHPAVDLCAGEKERGTMETLLVSPARRTEIVLGKFLTVLLFSMTTAMLNLVSIGITGMYMSSLAMAGAASRFGSLSLPPLSSLFWVVVVLIPLATLFSALCLSLAAFARSSKEGQYYLSPLLMVTLGLTMFCVSPGTEMQPIFSVMPVVGPGLLLKGLMKATGPEAETYLYAIPVLLTSAGYSLLALWWAIEQFRSEDILFGEAEQFNLQRWFRQLIRNKGPVPTFGQALLCFIVMLLLQFGSWKFIQTAMLHSPTDERGLFQIKVLVAQQILLIAGPPLLMGLLLTTSLRQTFSLRWPGCMRLASSAALALALHPLSLELLANVQWFFPPPPPGVAELMQQLKSTNLGLVLFAMAVTPAICEEIAFRGFLLSGFGSRHRTSLAVFLSSFAFGLIHMIPQQVFNAFLLGLFIAAICLQTRSLFPGMVFHFVYNSLGVLHDRWGHLVSTKQMWGLFFRSEGGLLRYQPALLCLAFAAVIGLFYAIRSGASKTKAESLT